jgi:hypothetical protein
MPQVLLLLKEVSKGVAPANSGTAELVPIHSEK